MPRPPWLRPMMLATGILVSLALVAPAAVLARDGGGGNGGEGEGRGDQGGGGGNAEPGHGGDDGDDADGGDDEGGGDGPGRGRNRGGEGNWDTSGSKEARGAVSHGVALPLARVIPVVRQAVPGRVLDIDLQQWASGGWVYRFLVLDSHGRYSEVFVDALRNRIVKVRGR